MTNTVYFHSVFRSDNESVSSSAELQTSDISEESVVNVQAPSLYSVIGQACLACARPATDNHSTISDFSEETDELATGLNSEDVNSDSEDVDFISQSQSPNFKSFSFEELKSATKNFRLDAGYMSDGNWSASKAWIDEDRLTRTKFYTGSPVAVVFLNQERARGNRQRLKELENLGRLSHPNLVRLFGFCLHNDLSLLVYEFLPQKSLFESWSIRMKIALGAAKGLAFLHSKKVIHQDFNSSAILLDKSYNTKVCNFWFPKDRRESNEIYGFNTATAILQYVAPEDIATGRITTKSNVYSFGVVLLEILSRRRASDQNLVQWAMPYLTKKQKIFIALDQDLRGQCSLRSAQKVAQLVLQCLSIEEQRPSMEMVVKSLEQLQD